MPKHNTSLIALQYQLYSTICEIKILAHAFDAVWEDGVGEDEAHGFTEGFAEVVDQLEEISKHMETLKAPHELNALANIVQLQGSH